MTTDKTRPPRKILVFAVSFLDELLTHPADEHVGKRLLEGLVADGLAEVEYRCDRDPSVPVTVEELAGVSATIADLERYSPDVLAAAGAGGLELVARYGVGVDSVDLDGAKAAGVTVANTPGANSLPTAEWAVSTLLSVAGRRVAQHSLASRGKGKSGPSRLDVSGKTLGIVGTGRIGRIVASLLSGFSMKVLANDLCPNTAWAEERGFRYVDLDELLSESDFVTLHASSTEQIIGARELDLMKSTACLINCARAHLVDDTEVYRRVAENRLFGYGVDDPWRRPDLPLDGERAETLNIVCGPHVGSESDQGKAGMRRMSAEAVDQWIRTGATAYQVR